MVRTGGGGEQPSLNYLIIAGTNPVSVGCNNGTCGRRAQSSRPPARGQLAATVLAPKLSGTGECPWGRRDRSFPPQDRDATYHHQPGPQETTPLIGPGSQISGPAPAGSCFAPVFLQIVASLASKSRRRAALAAPQLLRAAAV